MVTRQRARLMAAAAIAGTVSAFATAATAAADEPVEAGITVPVVEGLSADFMNGVDASSILSLEESGVTFRDFDGEEADVFDVFAEAGVNYSRIRVWNDPYDADGTATAAAPSTPSAPPRSGCVRPLPGCACSSTSITRTSGPIPGSSRCPRRGRA